MTNYIENGYLKIGVKDFGAVLTSVKSQNSGHEFLWQGNPDVWNGQSPILFPVIGKMLDDKYCLDGSEYVMIRHGLARHYDFVLIEKDENSMTFEQTQNEETLKSYPYNYSLKIRFELNDNALTVTHTVKNTNDCVMYFSIGAHPAFNCEIGDRVVFEKEETLYSERIDHDSVITGEKDLILDNSNEIVLREHTFDKDALIFEAPKSDKVTLESQSSDRRIVFTLGDAPFFAVWSKPNAPFVCLEPWHGINDSYDKKSDISEKRGIEKLNPNEEFSFSWTAEFFE